MRTQIPLEMLVPVEPESLDGGKTGGTRHQGIVAGGNVQATNINITQLVKKDVVKSFCTVQGPIDDFQGRTELLRTIHEKLQIGPGSAVSRKLALVGSRGMGKSELARKFVATYKGIYTNAAWIQAETDESCRQSFYSLAKALRLKPDSCESGSDIAKRVFHHTGKHIPSALFIYDNADKLKTTDGAAAFGIQDYLPSETYSHPPMVLITSQSTTEWRMDGIKTITVTQLTQTETIEYFRCRFQLSNKELLEGDQGLLLAQIQELAECFQGFPVGLQLAAGNVDHVPGPDSISKLRRDLGSFIKLIKDTANRGMMHGSGAGSMSTTAAGYSQMVRIAWDLNMKKLEREQCGPAALDLLRVLAYCNPERTLVKDLKLVFQAIAAPNENATQASDNFDLAIQALKKLAGVHVYEDGWWVNRVSCVRIQKLHQKFLREEDRVGAGLRSILMTEKASLALNFMSSEAVVTVPPSIMEDDDLMMAFLKCFSHGLRLDRTLKATTAATGSTVGRLQFGPRETQQLRQLGGANVERILAAVELIQTFEKEKDVAILYLTAVRHAKTQDGYFGQLAEIWAVTCWASNPRACSPFQFKRLTRTICAVSIMVLFITVFMDVVIDLEEGWQDLIVAELMHLVFLMLVNTAAHYVLPKILLCLYPIELKPALALQHNRLFHVFNTLSALLWVVGTFVLIVMSVLRTLAGGDDGISKNQLSKTKTLTLALKYTSAIFFTNIMPVTLITII